MSEDAPEYRSRRDLVSVEQRQVEFYGDELTAVQGEDGRVYTVISHMCDALGVDTQGQTRRIQRHQVLAKGYTWVDILSSQGDVEQRRRVQVLRVDLVPLWLTGISTRSIKDDETRQKLLRYQEEAATVLWEAFQEGRLTALDDFETILDNADPDLVQAYRQAQAIVRIARHQILLETRIANQEDRIDHVDRRLAALEERVAPGNPITEEQASQISQAVKAVAIALGKQTKHNEFGAIYGELYRRYGLTSYKLLPAEKFENAINWLTEWHQSIVDDAPF